MIKRGEEKKPKNRGKLVETGTVLQAFQNNLTCWLGLFVANKELQKILLEKSRL